MLEISSFVIRVMEIRVTTIVIPMVRPRMRKRTFPFHLLRLLIEVSLSFMDLFEAKTKIPDHCQIVLCTSTQGG